MVRPLYRQSARSPLESISHLLAPGLQGSLEIISQVCITNRMLTADVHAYSYTRLTG
jgi:hypothetical protein